MDHPMNELYFQIYIDERLGPSVPRFIAPPRRRREQVSLWRLSGTALSRLRDLLVGTPVLRSSAPDGLRR
jgi:hypothetical protein